MRGPAAPACRIAALQSCEPTPLPPPAAPPGLPASLPPRQGARISNHDVASINHAAYAALTRPSLARLAARRVEANADLEERVEAEVRPLRVLKLVDGLACHMHACLSVEHA